MLTSPFDLHVSLSAYQADFGNFNAGCTFTTYSPSAKINPLGFSLGTQGNFH
jgi:hypothetical protein